MRITNLLYQFNQFLKNLMENRSLIWAMSKQDLKSRFAGSYLGIIWVFIQPAVTIIILWFIFEIGFKSKPVDNFPFILWLSCGIIPFFFFQEGLVSATNSVIENKFLLSKVAFRISILPIIKIIAALTIHLFFIGILFLMFMLYGYYPDLYSFQIFYYLFCLVIFLLSVSWITSSTILFFKDIGQVVNILLQFWFWGTPIFWALNIIPKKFHFFLKLNPMYYIISGYRDSLINKVAFWQHYKLTILFWTFSIICLIIGALFFKKLRPHFADVV